MAMLIMLSAAALAEDDAAGLMSDVDLSQMQQAADSLQTDIDVYSNVMDIISGKTRLDGEYLVTVWNEVKSAAAASVGGTVGVFLAPLFVSAFFSRLLPANRRACELLCGCAGIAAFAPVMIEGMKQAGSLAEGLADMLEKTVPVLTTLSAVGGGTSSAALITPAATLLGEVMVKLIGGWGLALTGAAAVCACADCIGGSFRLKGLFSFMKRTVQTGAGLMLAIFAGILKVQGMLGASYDSAAVKTARFAVDKIVPAVGGGIADSMDAAISSVMLIKNAVGVTGMLVMITACISPVMKICASLIGIRLARAISQPVADTPLSAGMDEFGDVLRMLVVLCATSLTLSLILTGAAIGAGGSIYG